MLLIFPQYIFTKPPVIFVVPAKEEGLKKYQQWFLLIKYLNERSELTFEFELAKDHLTVQQGLTNKIYDISFVDPVWCIYLKERGVCEPLVRVVIQKKDTNRSLLIVHKDSIYYSLNDLKNKNIGLLFPYESDTGYYIPLVLLNKHNFPTLDNKNFIFTDTFISILKGVVYGKLDGGFINTNIYQDPKNFTQTKEIRVILESIVIPQWTVVVRKDLQKSIILTIKSLLLEIHNSQDGKKALLQAGFDKFIIAEDKDYQSLRDYIYNKGDKFAPKK